MSGNATGINVTTGGFVQVSGALAITTGANAGINVNLGGTAVLAGSAAQSLTCTASPSYGILATIGSLVQTTTSGSITITNCTSGVRALWNSVLLDNAAGTRTITGSSNPASADQLATYDHGNFPTGACGNGAECP